MSTDLVVRLHPDAPVDSGTFGTYLDGLQIQVYPADAPQTAANLLGQVPPDAGLAYTPIQLTEVPWSSGVYVSSVTKALANSTPPKSSSDFGPELDVDSGNGITFGSKVIYPADTGVFPGDATVNNIALPSGNVTKVSLSKEIQKFLAAGTSVTFYYQYPANALTFGSDDESFSFQLKAAAASSSKTPKTVKFSSTNGIAVGMEVTASGSAIPKGTTVSEIKDSSSVTLSNAVKLKKDDEVTFTCDLNTGIVQHVIQQTFDTIITWYVPIPQSVATAVIPLTPDPPSGSYLDIAVVATRNVGGQQVPIPVVSEFYNVIYQSSTPPTPYQAIPLTETSFYLTLPAPPKNNNPIPLTLPSDGSAPPFDELLPAVQAAVANDPYFPSSTDLSKLSADQCTRMAYDIVWSQQNTLPPPPDPLEQLYTDPPNSGGAAGSDGGDEQDRQKFEGAVNSFYSTRNADAVRLAKFVAAASGALYCEQKSVDAAQALLEFPVDPEAVTQSVAPVESEVLLTGLTPAGTNFGVPAGFFYALGANLDKRTQNDARYQYASGDTVQRLLQEFGLAVAAEVIGSSSDDSEQFAYPLPVPPAKNTNPSINSAQAARRLAALSGTTESTIPVLPLPSSASDPLVLLVQAWLNAPTAPTTPNPSYQTYLPSQDNGIWTTIEKAQPTGFLDLVLGALTQGYIVPPSGSKPSVALAALIDKFLASSTPNPTVDTLKNVTAEQWTSFFTTAPADPSWLPPFTQPGNVAPTTQKKLQPGYLANRVKAFVRAVQKFFTVSSAVNTVPAPTPGTPSSFDLPPFDAITLAVANLPSGFTFGKAALSSSDIATAVQGVFSPGSDPEAEAWLAEALAIINELYLIAGAVQEITPNAFPVPGNLDFSVMEALYARGFRSAKEIIALSPADFQQALTGTVAYAYAAALQTAASNLAPAPQPGGSGNGSFKPINDGSLIDCVPPPCLSPLGPVAYLQELLQLRQDSTCAKPEGGGTETDQSQDLAAAIQGRRGPLGSSLLASCANLETPMPLIDLVNECLESVASAPGQDGGAVYNTDLAKLRQSGLCAEGPEEEEACRLKPHELLAAVPQWSSPATPVQQPAAYLALANDFSAPCLPYSQPLDICRTYLDHLGTCRYEVMRTFRKEITEFTLDPTLPAPTFQSHLWRYPVLIDTAIEYLGINPEEYQKLFTMDIGDEPGTGGNLVLYELYGFPTADPGQVNWIDTVLSLPEFLERSGLPYCELVELQQSGCFTFVIQQGGDFNADSDATQPGEGTLPDCEPCCPELYRIKFTDPQDQSEALKKLAVFLRLWRKLQCVCGARYTFAELCDICQVFQLFIGSSINPDINPDFIRQLAAFQMLRDLFELQLHEKENQAGAHGAERTQLLALWTDPTANPAAWKWAVQHLIDRIRHYASKHHDCDDRAPQFVKLLADNLDPLSILAGFDPSTQTDTWHARPTNTLRFAEILSKICASPFGIGEILYLFTADQHLAGDDPFPLQEPNEALDQPLGLPDDEERHSLWALRRKLLDAELCEEEARQWSWQRIQAALRHEFGYEVPSGGPDYLTSLGEHFFPGILEHAGQPVSATARQYRVNLAANSPDMWNIPPDGPFRYDQIAGQLWTQLPLRDRAVVEKLEYLRELTSDEQNAVQNLYFMPRVDLAPFACFFPDFAAAERQLIEEPEEKERWDFFRRHFALSYKRCRIIADHLAEHAAAAGSPCREGDQAAWLILKSLYADENRAKNSWEPDSGVPPDVIFAPMPSGGSFAALLGLTGTGLSGEFSGAGGSVIWREVRGPMSAFGAERDQVNAPVPTILPALGLTLTSEQLKYVDVRNGFAIRDQDGTELGGAESFTAKWSGVLLIDEEGTYQFAAGAPTPEGQEPDAERAERCRWRVTLTRGQKSWIVLNHLYGDQGRIESSLQLRRGAYGIEVEFDQPPPDFSGVDDIRPQHTGFQVKYAGPDTGGAMETLPVRKLYQVLKDGTLDDPAIPFPEGSQAELFLQLLYTSTLRDIRRSYQRAFMALLFAHRFQLSGHRLTPYRQSELGYLLAHGDLFAGVSYFRNPSAFSRHVAYFNFNFLPVRDPYHPPSPDQDQRVQPSAKQEQALFDWWERIFDYGRMRADRERAVERPVWLLFEEALEKQPDEPAQLLRHLDVDLRHADLVLNYLQGQPPGIYQVTSSDLEDERWAVRAWHGDRWARRLQHCFQPLEIGTARPDLWGSDDPSLPVEPEKQSGVEDLTEFVDRLFLACCQPGRYADVKCINDGLRDRARRALVTYLRGMNRVRLADGSGGFVQTPGELSDFLLLDVEAGICEKASRIEEAITAVQTFIRRSRLGLEPGWTVDREFAVLWERRFANFQAWECCKRRELYKENWVDWDETERARRIEAFRLLESELRCASLSVAEPGGGQWWPDQRPRPHEGIAALQENVPSALKQLPSAPPTPEGWTLLGTPERHARPSWLSAQAPPASAPQPPPDTAGTAQRPGPAALAQSAAQEALPANLPFWLESAIRLGTPFVRVAAAGEPPARAEYHPEPGRDGQGCCAECGCVHPPLVDEYYFWLIDAQQFSEPSDDTTQPGGNPSGFQFGFIDLYYDQTQQQSVSWNDPAQLPQLLNWPANPAVRLAWCRVHNCQFGQPRRSVDCVLLDPNAGSPAGIEFLGRGRDSLYFSVTGAAAPATGGSDTSPPGFRYDLPSDEALTLPLPVAAGNPTTPDYPGGLPTYPFFAFDAPGAPLFPHSLYAPAMAVACALRLRCRFDLALKWYELAFAPLSSDCTWIDCAGSGTGTPDTQSTPTGAGGTPEAPAATAGGQGTGDGGQPSGACCDSTAVSEEVIHERAVTLHYCQTLLDWGQHLMRHRPSPEAFQQARLLFDTVAKIMGRRPRTLVLEEPEAPQTIASFTATFPALNPRLMGLYDHNLEHLEMVRCCVDAWRLKNGRVGCDMPYFGDSPLREGWRGGIDPCAEEADWCHPRSPYRFMFLIQKAKELAAGVREFGSALLGAYEKGDGNYLESLRAQQERELQVLQLAVKQDQWRDADWQIQALQQTKDLNQTHLIYNTNLYNSGLINDEIQHETLATTAMQTRTGANTVSAEGQVMKVIPDLFIGFPCNDTHVPLGTKLAGVFETIAAIMNIFGEIQKSTADLDLTVAGWQRRSDEWLHQMQTLPIEIEQTELQILGAQRRRAQALQELNNLQRQIEHSTEIQNFLRDKFTNDELYLWMQKETSALYCQMYELALHAARQAQHAFNFERGHTTRRFVEDCTWDTLYEGLLAGERLELALRNMEKAYLDENVRELELTKHISLRLQFPGAYLRLRSTGYCEIEIPEWMFDQDYPGNYKRRIKNVSLTVPCVTGPYTGVHCRLTLLSSMTRIDPACRPPAEHCCRDRDDRCGYEACPDDPRVVRQYAARECIATSSGQNDSGLFQLDFKDDRYLPFEYLGAVSRWRLEMPPENNYFDMDSLTDVIMHLNYTAREGGEALREAARYCAREKLPGDGWIFLDLRSDFPDAWALFRRGRTDRDEENGLAIRLSRRLFPYLPGDPAIGITRLAVLFETEKCCDPACPEASECPCPPEELHCGHLVEVKAERPGHDRDDSDQVEIRCVSSADWPRLYHGVAEIRIEPIGPCDEHRFLYLSFSEERCELTRAYLLCHYKVIDECCIRASET